MIQDILAGDEEAFGKLIQAYRHHLYHAAFAILRHPKDTEDVIQEVFVQVYLSLAHYQSQGLKAWLTRIAVNKAIDYKRRAKRIKEELTETLEYAETSSQLKNDVETPFMQKVGRELLENRLHQLPANYREVLYAYYFQEKSYQEIADEQGIAIKSVESKLYRAKMWIRKNWSEGDFG